MRRFTLIALAAAVLLSGTAASNAAGIGASVNVGPIGASVGIGTPSLEARSGFLAPGYVAAPALLGTPASLVTDRILNQSAVVEGGVMTVAPLSSGNLLGITALPVGTQIVSGLPLCEHAIILPGMVGMPKLSGCNVEVVAAQPMVQITQSAAAVVKETSTTTVSRVTTTKIAKKAIKHKKAHRRIQRRIVRSNPALQGS